jgi:hypothetical protein
MDKFEAFIIYVQNKKKNKLDPIEKYCKNIFNKTLNKSVLDSFTTGYNVNVHDVLTKVYKSLLKNNVCIICLLFSNGSKLYIDQYALCNIKYFKNMFENTDCMNNECVITEIPLIDTLDNYPIIKRIISFANYGGIKIRDPYDLYNIAVIDNYLLETVCKKYEGIHLEDDSGTYDNPKFISDTLLNIICAHLHLIFHNTKCESSKDMFNTIYNTCVMCNVDINSIDIPKYLLYDQAFMESLFYKNLNNDAKKTFRGTKIVYP